MTTEEFRRQNIDCGSATGQSISSTSKLQAKKKKRERERWKNLWIKRVLRDKLIIVTIKGDNYVNLNSA